ncbi:M61 family peptidase [Granulicella sp. 5B5]|uniref:M61 family metallopeptidase n=1 Tax=Granulicella sp. 5B5 TaxID=1617967 RepID=UPI0015F58D22|nr:M61 family metallopeptidase [Granulicella sp. 5B5]QMV17949.1 M61 family peptidase [Granulicella sp. 5B5]
MEIRLRVQLPLFLLASSLCAAHAQHAPIQIHADLTDAPRKIYHADIDLPVHRGPLDLITPEWIPGAHGPDGPIGDITGVRFEVDGKAIPWHRDPVDTYEYHVEIPAGASILHAHLDCVYARATRTTATLEWEDLMLYPAHTPVKDIAIQPTVTVPAHWGIGTSLKPLTPYDPQHPAGGTTKYAATTVEMLEDSPIMTGLYFHEYALAPGVTPQHYMDVIGPTAASIVAKPETVDQMSQLVREAFAMYGPPHYTSYHFLILLQGSGGGGGLEHHESSDNTIQTNFFTGYKPSVGMAGLLPHEFTHSWNGKYRRPDGLATPDYATPMRDNLLWVYEGLTNYLGDVMGERIGMVTAEQYRADLALTAAEMDANSGRAWRSIEDTTFDSAMPRNGGSRGTTWRSWKRGTDYYPEGSLVWLDVDTTIRRLTDDKKSLRDFLQIFLQKGGSGVARVEPYSLEELEADLNKVVANDWHGFFETRIYDVQPHVNTEGIEQGGYRLEYASEPTPDMAEELKRGSSLVSWFSIGLDEKTDGTISDVRVGSAADKAGFAPGQKMVSVDGQVFTIERLNEAVKAAKGTSMPIELMVQDEDTIAPVHLSYSEGLRYPRLVRVEGTPDLLKEILAPMAAAGLQH